jgi:hypothetical protein
MRQRNFRSHQLRMPRLLPLKRSEALVAAAVINFSNLTTWMCHPDRSEVEGSAFPRQTGILLCPNNVQPNNANPPK